MPSAKATPLPYTLPVRFDFIPQVLKDSDCWVAWSHTWDCNKRRSDGTLGDWNKPPRRVCDGNLASSTGGQSWCSFRQAEVAYKGGKFDGVGFVLYRSAGEVDGLVVIDLDHCRDPNTGAFDGWAREVILRINSYAEVSPSGAGAHVFCYGNLPASGRKRGKFEVYQHARYVTVTGQRLSSLPKTVELRQAELMAVYDRFIPRQTVCRKAKPSGGNRAVEAARRRVKVVVAVSGSGGHNATFYVACEFVRAGLSQEEVMAELLAWNQTNAMPPWTEYELAHKCSDAFKVVSRDR